MASDDVLLQDQALGLLNHIDLLEFLVGRPVNDMPRSVLDRALTLQSILVEHFTVITIVRRLSGVSVFLQTLELAL